MSAGALDGEDDDTLVCACMTVTRGRIVEAVRRDSLSDADAASALAPWHLAGAPANVNDGYRSGGGGVGGGREADRRGRGRYCFYGKQYLP